MAGAAPSYRSHQLMTLKFPETLIRAYTSYRLSSGWRHCKTWPVHSSVMGRYLSSFHKQTLPHAVSIKQAQEFPLLIHRCCRQSSSSRSRSSLKCRAITRSTVRKSLTIAVIKKVPNIMDQDSLLNETKINCSTPSCNKLPNKCL